MSCRERKKSPALSGFTPSTAGGVCSVSRLDSAFLLYFYSHAILNALFLVQKRKANMELHMFLFLLTGGSNTTASKDVGSIELWKGNRTFLKP